MASGGLVTILEVPIMPADTPSLLASQQRSSSIEAAIERDPGSFRILTGDRPTGALHLGHYFGTL
ncbi:MAG: hypothetical protein ACLQFR_07350, partial [Streptosporangiaceae bacterium]